MIYYWIFFLVIVLKNLMVVHSDETIPIRLNVAAYNKFRRTKGLGGYNRFRGTKGLGDVGGLFDKNLNDRDFIMWARLNNIPQEWIPHLKIIRRMEMFGGDGFPIRKDVERPGETDIKSLDFTTVITYETKSDTITEDTVTDGLQPTISEAMTEITPDLKLNIPPDNDFDIHKRFEKNLVDAEWETISRKRERERYSRIRRICISFAVCGTILLFLVVFLLHCCRKQKRKWQRAYYVADQEMPGSNQDASRAGFSIYVLSAGQCEKQTSRERDEVNILPLTVKNYSLSQPFIVPVEQPRNCQSAPPPYEL